MRKFLPASFVIASWFLLASTYAGPREEIVGHWHDAETGEVIAYKARGRLEQALPGGEIIRGRYSFPDDKHIMITLQSEMLPTGPVLTPIVIAGDDMQMIGPDGQKVKKFKRKNDQLANGVSSTR